MQNQNTKILKNTIFLYIRMVVILIIGLYTTRVILHSLGIIDYGIYSIVGGLVLLSSFLTSSLSTATSRFFSISEKLTLEKRVILFNTSHYIHICLGLLIVVFLETFGLWYLNNHLNIPIHRLDAANFVFHLIVLTTFFTITNVPFDALIISNEKMSVYAYFSIIEAIFKLITSYIVYYTDSDKLILYSISICLTTIIIKIMYILYCMRNFQECSFKLYFSLTEFKKIMSFFLWDLYGNFSVVVRTNGTDIIQNKFFGVAINATIGLTNQVNIGLMILSQNFMTAVRPQILKSYSQGDYKRTLELVLISSKLSPFLISLLSIPILVNIDFVLHLWLTSVPEYLSIFISLMIINSIISVIFLPLKFIIHAHGNIRALSLISGTILLLCIPASYFSLTLYKYPFVPYIVFISSTIISSFISLFIVKNIFPLINFSEFILKIFFKNILLICIIYVLTLYTLNLLPFKNNAFSFFLSIFINFSISLIVFYTFILKKIEKEFIFNLIKEKLNRLKK
ncbi:MATE family efflux transporter [Acinetobacter puyangensis]|uniref:Membrane protein involved in the export of O-antigen and teichoic acid n=1 Tax=Acinetobacter puyangensis TaxID=1096779 RepID=A0A240E913_9GAMM|nr:hypothetical protein [Acinetobacter puyangensis]SNX44405.1 Membrane protein involved in the export of O-antigen and teichoic acid [Acinetobacter puyangensis]